MQLRSERFYRLAADPPIVWAALCRVDQYRSWWPWLRRLEATALRAGDRWECAVRPPAPYILRFCLSLTEVEPPWLVRGTLTGDVEGEASLEIAGSPTGPGSQLRVTSELAPRHLKLRAVALVARPWAAFGHRWVVDSGVRQFSTFGLGPTARALPS